MRYLKTYTSYTSGSYAGRDDGYPTTSYQTFGSFDELAKSYGKKPNEKYFQLTPIPQDASFNNSIVASLEKETIKAKDGKKDIIENQIKKLQDELKKLK